MLAALLAPDGSTDRLPPATSLLLGLAVTLAAAWSSALLDLLYRPGLPPSLLLPWTLAKASASLSLLALWSAWLVAALTVLRLPIPHPADLLGRLLLTQAPLVLAAVLLAPFALLLPHETWVRGLVLGLLSLWSLGLQAGVIRRATGWNAARAWLFLLANLVLIALLIGLVLSGAAFDLTVRAFGRP